ncbi:SNF2 family amino-terminal protein [Rhizoctonia solani 123E]|uniref:SNF2 family amino-terminal protein n=1 Tax=Rhizoctonia solani 123E TaxID=1423351 RepID=A0A074SGD3_9AGAM|nr:SNF2 family amino-terminal protein [Rhizoctonia solani 123E]
MPLNRGPFGVRPFINNHFRLLCGLRPIQDAEDMSKDVAAHDENDHPYQYSSLSDGFLLSDEGRASLKPKDKKFFTDSARASHSEYLNQALKYALQHRASSASLSGTGKGKGKGKGNARKAEDDNDRLQSCISYAAAKDIPGHALFKGAILAMYNRPDGIMESIADIMKRTSRSPVHAWRDMAFEEPEANPYSLTVKSSKGVLHDLTTQASLELFGTIALTPSTRVPRPPYKPFIQAVLERVWERESRRLNRTLATAVETHDKCKNALEDATNAPTVVNLREASQAMKKYRNLVDITGGEMDESIKNLEASMKNLWAALGYVRDENGSMRRVKATKKVTSMTEDVMDRAYAAYVELHFPLEQDAIEEVTENLAIAMTLEDEVNVDLLGGTQGSDIGVAEYADKSLEEMFRLLGLTATRKIPFTSDELKVQWHQMVAIAVQIKAMFAKKLGGHAQPRLLCDEVGLGKTVEIIGTLCMLVHLIELQQRKLPLIPLLTGHVYFAGNEQIPLLPSIILMPKSLCIQWGLQIIRFTTLGSFRLIDYAKKGCDRISYFQKDGEYDQLVLKAGFPHRVIFLCTFTSIGTEAGETLFRAPTGAAGRESRFRGEPSAISTNNAPDNTVFAQQFLFFSCDELHQLRNATSCQDAATKLSCNSMVRTGATASPVFTGSKDAVASAVILRIPEMIGDEGYALGYELLESQRSRLKEWKARQSEQEVPASPSAFDLDDGNEHAHHDIAKTLLKKSDPRGYKTFFIQQPSIEIIRKTLTPYIIRRTSKSRTPDGNLILDIPDYVESVVWVALKKVENDTLLELYQRLMNEQPKGLQEEMLLSWASFLIDYKHTLFHHKMRSETLAPLEHFWEEWTLENYQELASSKLLATLTILDHYKKYPSASPLFFNRDGTRDLEREANFILPPTSIIPEKPRKILIFIMYHRHTQVTKFLLHLCGHKYLEYNGNQSDVERNQAIKDFETQDDVHVMLLSNVGTTGLNLAFASVVVFLSGLWSAQEGKQTLGRVARPGQIYIVHSYHILAPNTADEILSQYATSKAVMEDELFLQKKQLASKIFHSQDETDSDDSDVEVPFARATRSKVAPRALKGQKQTTDSSELAPPTKAQSKARKRKTPASSKAGAGPAEEVASGSQPKRLKVMQQGSHDDLAQTQSSSVGTDTIHTSVSKVDAPAASKKPQARPKMRERPSAQDRGATSLPSAPGHSEPVLEGTPGITNSIPVASTLSIPAPVAVALFAPPSESADVPLKDLASNVASDAFSISASAVSDGLPAPSDLLDSRLKGTDPGVPFSSTSTDPELSSEYDPDVDVVGDYEESDHLDKGKVD